MSVAGVTANYTAAASTLAQAPSRSPGSRKALFCCSNLHCRLTVYGQRERQAGPNSALLKYAKNIRKPLAAQRVGPEAAKGSLPYLPSEALLELAQLILFLEERERFVEAFRNLGEREEAKHTGCHPSAGPDWAPPPPDFPLTLVSSRMSCSSCDSAPVNAAPMSLR